MKVRLATRVTRGPNPNPRSKGLWNPGYKEYKRGDGSSNMNVIAGKTAEFLAKLFTKVGQNIGKSTKVRIFFFKSTKN